MSEAPSRTPQARRPDWAALIIAVALAAIAAVIYLDVARVAGMASYSRVSPAAFPNGVAVCLVGLALWTAFEALKGLFPAREPVEWGPVGWIVAGLVGQIALLPYAGFSLATGVVFAFTARGMGRGPLWLTIPIGTVFAFVIYVAFSKGLQLALPAGPIERLI